jgi:TadE-like protein
MFGRRMNRQRRGQALVEFALILPVLLLIIFGIVDAGRLIFTMNTVGNAARSAARVAIVNQSTAGSDTCDTLSATAYPIGCAIASGINLSIAPADVVVTYRDPADTGTCPPPPPPQPPGLQIGCLAVVQVTGHYTPLTPIIGQIIGSVTVQSTSKVPIERVCSNPPSPPLTNC